MPSSIRSRGPFPRIAAALLAVSLAFARPAHPGSDWPAVSPEHREQATARVEPGSDSEVLLMTQTLDTRREGTAVVVSRETFVRVKVFTPEGAQAWAAYRDDHVPRGWRLSEVQARTIRPDGTELAMDSRGIVQDVAERVRGRTTRRIAFAFPGVQPGCILDFRYRLYRRSAYLLGGYFPLQMRVPIQKLEVRIKPVLREGILMRQLTFHSAARPAQTPTGGYYETLLSNQRAFRPEPDMPPEQQQLGFMVVFYTSDEHTAPETYWAAVGKRQAEDFEAASRPDRPMREAAIALAAGATTDRERVERVARWLRAEFRIDRSEDPDSLQALGLRAPADARAAWRQKGGRPSDALRVFAALARGAGLQARWVMVPPRDELFFDRNMMDEDYLDHVQVAILLDGRWVTFDPMARYLPWDMQPWADEATLALLCDRDSTRFIETSFSGPDRTVRARAAELELRDDGTLEGTLRVTCSGHFNAELRELLDGVSPRELDALLWKTQSDGGPQGALSRAVLANPAAETEPLRISAHLVLPRFATVAGSRIIVEPAVFQAHARPRFTSSTRRHAVYFEHPWSEVDTVRIRAPQGWRIHAVDPAQPLEAEGVADYGSSIRTSDDGREVLYLRRFRMGIGGTIYFPPRFYPGVRQLFDGVRTRDGASLVLVKDEAQR